MIQTESGSGGQRPLRQQMVRERDWQHLLLLLIVIIITSATVGR
jgi:hypothetical protein